MQKYDKQMQQFCKFVFIVTTMHVPILDQLHHPLLSQGLPKKYIEVYPITITPRYLSEIRKSQLRWEHIGSCTNRPTQNMTSSIDAPYRSHLK